MIMVSVCFSNKNSLGLFGTITCKGISQCMHSTIVHKSKWGVTKKNEQKNIKTKVEKVGKNNIFLMSILTIHFAFVNYRGRLCVLGIFRQMRWWFGGKKGEKRERWRWSGDGRFRMSDEFHLQRPLNGNMVSTCEKFNMHHFLAHLSQESTVSKTDEIK